MQTLGQRLRAEREKRGWTLEELAQRTRIKQSYFEAIENDDPAGLPGGFFYRSFIRQYARLLELPDSVFEERITQSLEQERRALDEMESALPDRHIDVPPMPTGRVNRSLELKKLGLRFAALLGVVAGCGLVYSAYTRWGNSLVSRSLASLSTPAPQQAAVPAQEPANADGGYQARTVESQSQGESPPGTHYEIQLILRAVEDTWVQVTQQDQRIFSGILRQGESKVFEGTERLRVRLGNAGGVEIEWNGKQVPSMGPKGQVRVVDFTTADYSVVPPKRPVSDQPSL
jgi:transcriptional regulator with XRE-family HTH domain